MKIYFLFILVGFSSIVFGQSGFNPPKTKIAEPLKVENIGIDTVRVLDSVRVHFENQYIDTAVSSRIDTTNALLKQFYFENCGNAIPSTHIGWDFDLPVDFGTTDATDTWFHLLELSSQHFYPPSISNPTTPILVDGNETAINSFIQSSLIADGYVGDELILVVNPDKTITIWASPSYVPNGDEFWLGTSTPDIYTNKLFPTIPTVNQGGALLVKVCEPLNVEVSFPADIEYNINETFDINNSTVVFPANTIHSYTIIGITGTYDLTEVSSILAIPAGVTQTSTADGYLQNDVTVFTTGRVIIKTIR